MLVNDEAIPGAWEVFILAACEPLRALPRVHVVPEIPAEIARGAAACYLDLRGDETLLAIVEGTGAEDGIALTTRRVCWAEPVRPSGRALDYAAVPDAPGTHEVLAAVLGPARAYLMGSRDPAIAEALAGFLRTVSAAARAGIAPAVAAGVEEQARTLWPRVAQQTEPMRPPQATGQSFQAQLKAATPRAFVTPLIALACITVYLAMVLSGVSPVEPDIPSLLAWGADFGPYVVNDHQEWRLVTNLFIHIGFIHLALNLWCLLSAAPLVERLYGNLGFAVLYLMAGLGGSIASIAWHPLMISAGASGAIFGVYGALGAFLALHRNVIPASILKPLRGSTLSFVGYNLIVGAMDRRIDTAAHLGGLVAGFVAGLSISRPWPVTPEAARTGRRLVLGGVAALGLFAAYGNVRATIRKDPELAQVSEAGERAGTALNRFVAKARPEMEDYDRINHDIDRIITQLQNPNPPPPALAPDKATLNKTLADLAARAEADRTRLEQIPVEGEDLSMMRRSLGRAFSSLVEALNSLRRAIETNDATFLSGPEGFSHHHQGSQEHLKTYVSALQDYAAKYHLKLGPR